MRAFFVGGSVSSLVKFSAIGRLVDELDGVVEVVDGRRKPVTKLFCARVNVYSFPSIILQIAFSKSKLSR